MVAFLYRMAAGIPGDVTRAESADVAPGNYDSSAPFPAYGLPGKFVAGKFVPVGAGDTAAVVAGVLVRPFPTQSSQNALGAAVPPTSGHCNVLRRGRISILLGGTAPAVKGGTVYVRIAAPAAGKPIGGFEAAADSTNTIALPATTTFAGPADAGAVTELEFNI
ncbi:hypothetical protein [Methylobacterium sp. CCH5-D2]|uniref:structural cement protein Gp24 n=1 Tax=Methylobacterium sp. CCH5-D2 TaxID=1768765 RepID=UPI000832A5E3|nr:hypothetical protein [Methylobacterium sp. CCH5-D2]